MSSTSSPQRQPPPILGIDHLKLPTNSLPAKLAFYTSILPFTHLTQFDHRHADSKELFAVILQHPQTELLLELRLHPAQAAAQKGGTRSRGASRRARTSRRGARGSSRMTSSGWVLVAEDPDRAMVRWYCKETHEWDSNVDSGELYVRQSRGSFFINGWPQIRGGLDSEAEANSTANPS
ncbi:hypothetical protein B0H13DRAFT_2668346 [Mycena leptocephala]|nr:hypothetical protein B0H13DRAFT_2668346 [Mycena leptocephala]